ncbi:MAG: NUDIX domain-containing protein [Ktedonobacterales bacterium]
MESGEQTGAPANPTHVVSCFVLRAAADGDRVLLVRRSERVRTYRGAWAAISGYLEPKVGPLEQAFTELSEEAALSEDDVAFVRQGAELPVVDETAGLSWIVHPLLFRLLAPDKLTTDWEAVEYRWVAPDDLRTLQTVPMLAEAFAAVYPGGTRTDDPPA